MPFLNTAHLFNVFHVSTIYQQSINLTEHTKCTDYKLTLCQWELSFLNTLCSTTQPRLYFYHVTKILKEWESSFLNTAHLLSLFYFLPHINNRDHRHQLYTAYRIWPNSNVIVLGIVILNQLNSPRFTCPKIDIFLISRRKHMLWVLIRSALVRRFQRSSSNDYPRLLWKIRKIYIPHNLGTLLS